jgi:aconitate hydratase
MMRGTFANIRIRNLLRRARGRRDQALPVGRGDVDLRRGHALPGRGPPLVVFAGKEYGTGSSRDWAAKGTSCSACAR